MEEDADFALLESEPLDQIIERTGGLVQEFRVKTTTLIIWIVVGFVAVLIGLGGVALILDLAIEARLSDKPEDKLTFQQKLKIGTIFLLLVGVIYFGVDRIKHSRKLLGSRILATRDAFLFVKRDSTKIFRWKDIGRFQQDRIKGTNEKHPSYPAMNRDMSCSIIRTDGEQFDYDFDTIENHQAFTRLVYDALKGTEVPWEFREKN